MSPYFGSVIPGDLSRPKRPSLSRESLRRSVIALRFVANTERNRTGVEPKDTQEWKDAARIEKWLKATR